MANNTGEDESDCCYCKCCDEDESGENCEDRCDRRCNDCLECKCICPPTFPKLLKCFVISIVLGTLNLWFWNNTSYKFRETWSPREIPFLPQTFKDQHRPNASLAAFLYPSDSENTCIAELSQPGILPFKDVRDLRAMPVHAFYINVAAHSERRQRIERRFEASARQYGTGSTPAESNEELDAEEEGGDHQSRGNTNSADLGVGATGKRMGDYHLHRVDAVTGCRGGKYHCVVESHLRAIESATHYLAVDRPNEFQDFALIMEDDITLELDAFWSVRLLYSLAFTHSLTHSLTHSECFKVRPGFEQYGATAFFDADGQLVQVYWSHGKP